MNSYTSTIYGRCQNATDSQSALQVTNAHTSTLIPHSNDLHVPTMTEDSAHLVPSVLTGIFARIRFADSTYVDFARMVRTARRVRIRDSQRI